MNKAQAREIAWREYSDDHWPTVGNEGELFNAGFYRGYAAGLAHNASEVEALKAQLKVAERALGNIRFVGISSKSVDYLPLPVIAAEALKAMADIKPNDV